LSKRTTPINRGKNWLTASRIRQAQRSGGNGIGLYVTASANRGTGGRSRCFINLEILFTRHDGYVSRVRLLRGPAVTTKYRSRLTKKNADARILLAFFGSEAVPSKGVVGATVSGGSFGGALEAIIQATSEQRANATTNIKDIIPAKENRTLCYFSRAQLTISQAMVQSAP
jgi:hypothetical protein